MKPENQKAIEEFLARSDAISDDILEEAEKMFGSMPFILPILRERPKYFAPAVLADDLVCRPEHLSPKTAELVALSAAAATGAQHCMKVHIGAAVKEGASRDEILDTILIAALVGKSRVLATSLREFCDAFPEKTEADSSHP